METSGKAGRALGRDLAALALFVVLTLAMLYPYPRQAATHLRTLGDPLEYTWLLGYSAHRLVTAPLDLYDAPIFYPFKGALAFGEAAVGNSLVALPIVLATGNPVLGQNLLIILQFVLAGFGAYLLSHDLTGSRAAGAAAGVIYAFNPYRMDRLLAPILLADCWLPFVFWALNRLVAGRSRWWAVALAAFLGLEFLSAVTLAYVAGLALAVYLLCVLAAQPRQLLRPGVALPLFAALAASGAILLATSLPYLDVSRRYEMQRTLEDAEHFSARPLSYLGVTSFNRTWGRVKWLVDRGSLERQLFPGLLAATLAVVGLAKGAPRSRSVPFGIVGLFAFVLTLGPSPFLSAQGPPVDLPFPMPYRVLFDYLPGFEAMRVPARFAIAVMLAIGVLAGFGAAYVVRLAARLGAGPTTPPLRSPRTRGDVPSSPRAGRAGEEAAGLPTWLPGRRIALAALLVGVALLEYVSIPLAMQPIATGQAIPEVYQWLRDQPDRQVLLELPIDVEVFHTTPYMYFATYHHWTLVNGWRSFVPPGYAELAKLLQGFPSPESIQALANLKVKYVVVHEDKMPPWELPGQKQRLQQHAGQVKLVRQFGSDYVYEVSAPPKPPALRLALYSSCVAQPGREYPAYLIFDGLGRNPIVLPDAPDQLAAAAEWSSEDGKRFRQDLRVEAPDAVIRSGRSLRLDLAAPPAPGSYRLSVAVSPPLSPLSIGPEPRAVAVQDRASPSGPQPPQALAFDLPRAARTTEPIPLQITWKAQCPDDLSSQTFVNVYDDGYKVWSQGSRTAPGAGQAGRAGGQASDSREVLLDPETPSGYYWVEFGLLDPITGQRQRILDPAGKPVDKVTVGPLRVIKASAGAGAPAVPRYQTRADLGDQVRLLGWTGATETLRPGETFRLRLYWEAAKPLGTSYNVFVHLYDRDGRLVAQRDSPPGGGAWPTSSWQPGDVIEDEYQLPVPADLPAGEYTLAAGMYDLATMRRLPLVEGPGLGDDRILIAKLKTPD